MNRVLYESSGIEDYTKLSQVKFRNRVLYGNARLCNQPTPNQGSRTRSRAVKTKSGETIPTKLYPTD